MFGGEKNIANQKFSEKKNFHDRFRFSTSFMYFFLIIKEKDITS
jgi:hypothetical protein